ncbi:MAG: hypothetical protein PSV35_08915 [bacterium]|nr:hypothetical protein [bacterium]
MIRQNDGIKIVVTSIFIVPDFKHHVDTTYMLLAVFTTQAFSAKTSTNKDKLFCSINPLFWNYV